MAIVIHASGIGEAGAVPEGDDHPAGLEEDHVVGLARARRPAEALVELAGAREVGYAQGDEADALLHTTIVARRRTNLTPMKISVAADELTGIAEALVEELRRRGHEPLLHGALAERERDDWAWASEAAARDVVEGRAEQGIVCCWTGTGASIAANKVAGVRAALCADGDTARGARKWNDANVLALSLNTTSEALLGEILDGWFEGEASTDEDDVANIRHVDEI